ncbi:MAG: hypothetical protein CMP08_07115 [Xanthomonadales bacterium]|nr:hypothetical protein [Xanthomonadales bacterium]
MAPVWPPISLPMAAPAAPPRPPPMAFSSVSSASAAPLARDRPTPSRSVVICFLIRTSLIRLLRQVLHRAHARVDSRALCRAPGYAGASHRRGDGDSVVVVIVVIVIVVIMVVAVVMVVIVAELVSDHRPTGTAQTATDDSAGLTADLVADRRTRSATHAAADRVFQHVVIGQCRAGNTEQAEQKNSHVFHVRTSSM